MATRFPKRFAYVPIGLVMAGVVFFVQHRHRDLEASFETGHMPVCKSPVIRQLFTQTLTDGPDADGLKVLKLGDVLDVTPPKPTDPDEPQPRPGHRRCLADVFTNIRRELVLFELDWTDDKQNEVYLTIPDPPS